MVHANCHVIKTIPVTFSQLFIEFISIQIKPYKSVSDEKSQPRSFCSLFY